MGAFQKFVEWGTDAQYVEIGNIAQMQENQRYFARGQLQLSWLKWLCLYDLQIQILFMFYLV